MGFYKIKGRRPDVFEVKVKPDKRERMLPHWQRWARETADHLKSEKQPERGKREQS